MTAGQVAFRAVGVTDIANVEDAVVVIGSLKATTIGIDAPVVALVPTYVVVIPVIVGAV
ncbi:hypothetical protein LBMAG38_24940 [Chloroflexota bacterium]|nr:hypothetical protein LBMAG38_24940 [Chloroflexota bacterium]